MLDTIKPFCGSPESGWQRYDMRSPWTEGDWTYATDAHAIVRVPKCLEADGSVRPPLGGLQFDKFPLVDSKEMPVVADAKTKPCADCQDGKMMECPECYGTGTWSEMGDYSHNDYECDCHLCDGTGLITAKEAERLRIKPTALNCESCGGSGQVVDESCVVIDGLSVADKYLRLVWGLGECQYQVSGNYLLFQSAAGHQGIVIGKPG